MTPTPLPVLEALGVGIALGGRSVLGGISLSVRAGDVVAVVGANGSGKTTLLRVLAGVLAPDCGRVQLGGRQLERLLPRERGRAVAYLPQHHEIPPGFRAAALVEMGRHPHAGEGDAARRRCVLAALALVGATSLAGRRLETLSGGELQKVFLASVVAQAAPVLLLDEPTVFLDPGRGLEVQRALLGLAARGTALVLATHELDFAVRFATRVVGLKDGRFAFDGPPGRVLTAGALGDLFGAPLSIAPIPASPRPANTEEGPDSVSPGPSRNVERVSLGMASEDDVLRGDPAAPPPPMAPLLPVALACAAVLLAAPLAGPSLPGGSATAANDPLAGFILWQLRVPRVLLAALAGGCLAVAGAAFQALFRNPLATPYTLGVASGAALGAVATLVGGAGISFAGTTGTSLGALAGALTITGAVYGLGSRRGGLPTASLLLAGVTLSFLFSALILLLQYLADFTQAFRILRWLMGEVRIVGYGPFAVLAPLVAVGAWLVLGSAAELNLLLTGEELAQARGVAVEKLKRRLFLGSSLLVGGVVALCGPIGFVGLIVPHALRPLVGPDHRRLLPACAPAGAAFLVVCDTVARLALAPAELPVGVVTALLGGPFFLAILLRRVPHPAA